MQQKIEQLERRIEALEKHTLGQSVQPEKTTVAAAPVQEQGYARVNYWLGRDAAFGDNATAPLAQGKMRLDSEILLRPQLYVSDKNTGGVFSEYHDSSLYPVASLQIEGVLDMPQAGDYTLTIKATPPREVGGSGNVKMAVRLYLDGELIYTRPYSSSLSPSTETIPLAAGETTLRLEVVALSPGFGPSPTRARLFVGLHGSDAVSPEPLSRYLLPPS
ncbi:MAG: hypothetical protein OQK54_06000 [Gammaproteobacteria bacterium]|nr:hypothetical protein [Gammaproteobacteria bacterium]